MVEGEQQFLRQAKTAKNPETGRNLGDAGHCV
jgi:hypothetical protein